MQAAIGRVRALGYAPRELWLVYCLKMLESFAYFSSSLNLGQYLTASFGFTDLEAGALYSVWGVVAGVIGMLIGPLIDRLGVRTSLLVGGSLLTAGRVVFAGATTRSQLYVSLFVLQPIGMSLGIPVLGIAIRRLTTDSTRGTAYGIFYSAMNVAALVSGVATDAIRSLLIGKDGSDEKALRGLFWIGAATSLVYTAVAAIWFRPVYPPAIISVELEEVPAEPESGWRKSLREARETSRDGVFWRLVAFSGVIFGARSIFRHMDATLPRWMEREIGPSAKYGLVYSINPAIIIVAVPLLQARLTDFDPYSCVMLGTTLTAAAPLVLAAFPASYASAVVFMLFLSAGEAIYSPLLYTYVMALSPPGREGVYGTLAAAPLFLVKVIVGTAGGELLGLYCPVKGPRNCQVMWLIIACMAISTPVGLVLFRKYLYNDTVKDRVKEYRDQELLAK